MKYAHTRLGSEAPRIDKRTDTRADMSCEGTMLLSAAWFLWPLLVLAVVCTATPVSGQASICSDFSGVDDAFVGVGTTQGNLSPVRNCPASPSGFSCYEPELLGLAFTTPSCNPLTSTCTVRATVDLEVNGTSINNSIILASWTTVDWELNNSAIGECGIDGKVNQDLFRTWVDVGGFSCANPAGLETSGTFEVIVRTCRVTDCPKIETFSFAMDGPRLYEQLCRTPPPPKCKNCSVCPIGGPGAPPKVGRSAGGSGSPVNGGGAAAVPQGSGPDVTLRYLAGGVGRVGFPGTTAWNETLGRYWSHEGAERIVIDPDEDHVWMLTRDGGFIEYTNTSSGSPPDPYEDVLPLDEAYDTLYRTSTGWALHFLDGTVQTFDDDGLWVQTVDRNLNETNAFYDTGVLERIEHPTGRHELFAYNGTSGLLETITERGVGVTDCGSTPEGCRTWTYTWEGLDLVSIERPDGTTWELTYGAEQPGYLTLLTLVGTDDTTTRIEGAWAYDTAGNAYRFWKGAAIWTSPDAVEKWELGFDDPTTPTETTVADPLYNASGGTDGNLATYTFDQPDDSGRPRLLEVDGDCPSCGMAPNTTLAYTDANNPYRPTSETDSKGHVTTYTYDANGMMTSRTEADGETLERTTTWTYDSTYPALVETITQDSVETGEDRETIITRDTNGDPLSTTIEGFEAGDPFSLETERTFNAAGLPSTIDPPGYGTDDVTTYTYDEDRGHLFPLTRSDPIIGGTADSEYDYDPFNRRISMIDPNGLETVTEYDELNRVTTTTPIDPGTSEELVTENEYTVFGDLLRTILPEGNVIEYGYDHVGRLVSIERKPDESTPGERTVYTLDDIGNRIQEDLEVWVAGASDYATASTTEYEYSTRCHLDKILHPGGSDTEYAYDCNGNLEKVWDANHPSSGQTATPSQLYAYDELDRLESVTQPFLPSSTAVTSYEYDVQDHLTAVIDAEGNRTEYVYSDRDLLTAEISPVSGTTLHEYNEHGEPVETTDARSVVVARTIDALDRVTLVDYPDNGQNVSYSYDTGTNALGRLVGITRHSATVAYAYDGFGRLVTDGALSYDYDGNGNRVEIGYPGGVTATYAYDFADRELSLDVDLGAGAVAVAGQATYLPSGPLMTLVLGSGAIEQRGFDARYFPVSIQAIAQETQTWTYQTDDVGNVLEIERVGGCTSVVELDEESIDEAAVVEACIEVSAEDTTVDTTEAVVFRAGEQIVLKEGFTVVQEGFTAVIEEPEASTSQAIEYGYRDHQYFLTSAAGAAWGDLEWTYDKIGNRLSEEVDSGTPDAYEYVVNGASGNSPVLDEIQLSVGGTAQYTFGAAGHLLEVDRGANVVGFGVDDEGRHDAFTRFASSSPVAEVGLSYDGRSFLRRADELASSSPTGYYVAPTYSSEGVLLSLLRDPGPSDPEERVSVFYLAGRPVAQVRQVAGGSTDWTYLTTDHLGTVLLATDELGEEEWIGPFRPFGQDYFQGTAAGALDNGVFLRLPGQWEDDLWADATSGADVLYNVHRWYETAIGRYASADPLGERQDPNVYFYATGNPLGYVDPLGLSCQLNAPWKKCLSALFGAPVDQVRIFDHARYMTNLHGGLITTRPNTIYLPGRCGDFWASPRRVLHELHHVVAQWSGSGARRMNTARYVFESGRAWVSGKHPYWDNRYEQEASDFSAASLRRFKECIGCAATPPDPTAPPPMSGLYDRCGRFGQTCMRELDAPWGK